MNRLSIFSDGSELESAKGRHELKGQGYFERDEKRILNALGRGLLNEFPNPERAGCPGRDVLKRIASHEMPLTEAEKWLDHLGSCSPCYADFNRFQEARESRRREMALAVAAGILLAVAVTGWALLHKRSENLTAQTAVLDLRRRSIARGAESNPSEPPLEISRNVSRLKIYLPIGSAEGDYDIRIVTPEERTLWAAEGKARKQEGFTSLTVDIKLSSASPGLYVLQLQKSGSEWTSYPLRVE